MKKCLSLICLLVLAVGCGKSQPKMPTFTLAYSEYVSWSVFGVASEKGLINGAVGQTGPIENYWGIDIELKEVSYDGCIGLYSANTVDATCLTNIDSLGPSLSRPTVFIMPTSTSVGADAVLLTDWDGQTPVEEVLLNRTTYGLENTVSQYAFNRSLEKRGADVSKYSYQQKDPDVAAQAMQTGQEGFTSIEVWNPFKNQTLKNRPDVRVGFSSIEIPEEIIDGVVVGQNVLEREGGDNFACAIIDTFYAVSDLIANPEQHNDTVVALGAKFSDLNLQEMEQVLVETRFYSTPDEALALFASPAFRQETMPRVIDFCVQHGLIAEPDAFTVSFNNDEYLARQGGKYSLVANQAEKVSPIVFTSDYIEQVKSKRESQ